MHAYEVVLLWLSGYIAPSTWTIFESGAFEVEFFSKSRIIGRETLHNKEHIIFCSSRATILEEQWGNFFMCVYSQGTHASNSSDNL